MAVPPALVAATVAVAPLTVSVPPLGKSIPLTVLLATSIVALLILSRISGVITISPTVKAPFAIFTVEPDSAGIILAEMPLPLTVVSSLKVSSFALIENSPSDE